MIKTVFALTLFAFVLSAPVASSQTGSTGELGPLSGTNVGAPGFFYKFERNEELISIKTAGALPNGVFVIGSGTTIIDVISLAGGVTVDRLGDATVRLLRQGRVISESELRDLYANPDSSPVLQENDIVEVVGLVSDVSGFYVHTNPGVESIEVTASGAFAAPGRYTLDVGSNVGDLVAYAGGLGLIGVRDFRTDVTATVRLYRAGEVVMESPLKELYTLPTMTLQPGDAVDLEIISRSRTSLWRDALSVTTALVGIIVLVERVLR